MSEKIGGAKGTELDDDFHEMERVRIVYLDIFPRCYPISVNIK